MMLLDPSNEDGVCSVDYAEWKAEPYDSMVVMVSGTMMSRITNGSVSNVCYM